MSTARHASAQIDYNGKAVKADFTDDTSSMTYTDPASGESDSLSITLEDADRRWTAAWFPVKGDAISAKIALTDWMDDGDNREIDCGAFVLSGFSMQGAPGTVSLEAVAQPVDLAWSTTERSKTWEKITAQEIAADMAGRAGLALTYDAEAISIDAIEQNKKPDSSFLQELCDKYGLQMKVYAKKLILYDRAKYKEKPAAATIPIEEVAAGWTYNTDLVGSYTGGTIAYTDPKTEKDIVYKYNETSPRLLEVTEKADSAADAEKRLKAEIEKANHGLTTLSVTLMGGLYEVYAGQCVEMTGFGRLSGKYYVDKVTHELSTSGYSMQLELALVSSGTDAAMQDALDRLTAAGIMNSPEYWADKMDQVPYLSDLLLNLSVMTNGAGGGTTDDPVAALQAAGVINTPDYWTQAAQSVPYLDQLLQNAAGAL